MIFTKPLIGLMPLWDDQKESLWMLPGYVDGIKKAGGLPVIFPFTEDDGELEQLCSMCSGFLFLHVCDGETRKEKLRERALNGGYAEHFGGIISAGSKL